MSSHLRTYEADDPPLTSADRIRVIRAVDEARRVLGHNPPRAVATFFEDKIQACRRWLSDSIDEATDANFSAIKDLLFLVDRGKLVACHPNILPIKKIAHATRHMIDWLVEPEWAAWQEYGDVFQLLSEILRCSKCYDTLHYNSIDQETRSQYDWGTIAQALIADLSLTLPSGYVRPSASLGRQLPDEEITRLSQSVRQASLTLGIRYEAVAWQIIRYRVYNETPEGPRWSLRGGHWDMLAGHTSYIADLLWPMADPEGICSPQTGGSARTLLKLIQCVQEKWFDEVTSGAEFMPSALAIVLTREMEHKTGHCFDTLPGSEPLFDIPAFTKELMDTNSLVGDGDDYTNFPDHDEAVARFSGHRHRNRRGNVTWNDQRRLLGGPSPFPHAISRDAHQPPRPYSRRNQGRRGNFPRTDLPPRTGPPLSPYWRGGGNNHNNMDQDPQ